MSTQKIYDLIIIGSGPAGLTASIYASRFRLDNLVIGQALGGLAFEAHKICNFPSESEIKGMDLVGKMREHVESLGAEIAIDKIVDIKKEDGKFKIVTQGNKEFFSKIILLATGTEHRKLNLEGESKLIGKGVSYCATCDAMFYKNKIVAVVGGSNSAHTASLYLAEIAERVYQIYRGDKLRGEMVWVDQVMKNKKIEVIFNTQIKELKGDKQLEKIVLDKPYQNNSELDVDGLFVEIGTVPQKELIDMLRLDIDEYGYVKVEVNQKTNIEGVWSAGDITNASNNFRQIITAASEGAIAAEDIFKSLKNKK